MKSKSPFSRRQFIASTGAFVVASQMNQGIAAPAATADAETLAVNGGTKAVSRAMPKPKRWGQPELDQLGEAVAQNSLYYWKNKQTQLLTERYQKIYQHKFVHPCSSGSAALHIATAAAGVAPGDEVITSGITDIGTVIGTLFQMGVPVFADIEPHTGCLDPVDVEKKITPKTKAIIAVHLAGNPAKLAELKDIADRHQLVLIEDCAQAWGAQYRGKPIATTGQISCFSFQDTKQITCGDGGLVATQEDRFGPLLIKFGDKGTNRLNPKDTATALGCNYRMSELQAAFAAAQMNRLEGIATKRSQLGTLLTQELADIPAITTQAVRPDDRCVYWFYFMRLVPEKVRCKRAEFVKALAAEGAPFTNGYIPVPLYGMPMFQNHSFFAGRWPAKELGLTNMDYRKVKCPQTEAWLETSMLFRLNEAMDETYIREIAKAVRKVAKHYAV